MKVQIITVDGSTLQKRIGKLIKGMEKTYIMPIDAETEKQFSDYLKECIHSIVNRSIVLTAKNSEVV